MDGWNTSFLLGPGLFSGAFAVSFRECIFHPCLTTFKFRKKLGVHLEMGDDHPNAHRTLAITVLPALLGALLEGAGIKSE